MASIVPNKIILKVRKNILQISLYLQQMLEQIRSQKEQNFH